MYTTQQLNSIQGLPMEELSNYHSLLAQQCNDPKVQLTINPDTTKLLPFNGYYTLNAANGAFLAIDTNMVVQPNVAPVYIITLLISLDGVTSARYDFSGTFDGTHLAQQANGLTIDLVFTRPTGAYGPTVNCSGSITLPGKTAVSVSGNTYNNPIPADLFIGDFYNSTAPTQKVMSIQANNVLMYDGGTSNGVLQTVPSYVYNMNMYYFSFQQGETMVKLIMGTAAAQGFACNNMSVTGASVVSRSLLTIPKAAPITEIPYIENTQLPDFSGYYQIPQANAPLAFLSVQAQYITLSEKWDWDVYLVMISYSLDGVTSKGFCVDLSKGMIFNNATNTLTVPASKGQDALTLTFTRSYNPTTGSLVNVTGTINNLPISGSTLFNPVPLSAFGGVPLTNKNGDKMTINNDNSVTFNDTIYNSIIYVPLMYIVAAPVKNTNLVLSLGTDGLRGNACIVTIATLDNATNPVISAVYAIDGPE